MSRRIVAYDQDRRAIWSDDGPSAARTQGRGGVSLGWFQGTVVDGRRGRWDEGRRLRNAVSKPAEGVTP